MKSIAWQKIHKCRRAGISYDLTPDFLVALYRAQNGRCALSGTPLRLGTGPAQDDTLAIDRIDAKLGYVKGNVRLVTWHANAARWSFGDAKLLALARAILATDEGKAAKQLSSPASIGERRCEGRGPSTPRFCAANDNHEH